jgi:hypothetical protein
MSTRRIDYGGDPQPAKLAHAEPGGVHELEHRRVAAAFVGRRVRGREEALDLLERQYAGELPSELRSVD